MLRPKNSLVNWLTSEPQKRAPSANAQTHGTSWAKSVNDVFGASFLVVPFSFLIFL